jgi:XTP/dITP diphosphohydrolase
LRLYCATTNSGKLREFRMALADSVEPLPGLNSIMACEETGATFEENAIQKALYYSQHCEGYLFVDDSGLEVDALGGAPGVYSARFAGAEATDEANNALLLERMRGVADRTARFVCVVALAESGGLIQTFRGEVEGRLLDEPRGDNGFGYDPLFFYPSVRLCLWRGAAGTENAGESPRASAARLAAGVGLRAPLVFPACIRRRLRAADIQIHHNRLLPAADHHALHRAVGISVDFLVRNVGRNVDEVARPGLVGKLKLLSPAESRAAFHYIKDSFQVAVMVCSRLGVGFHYHGSCPQLVGAGAGVIDGGGASHARSLRRVGVQLAGAHDADAVLLPIHGAAQERTGASRRLLNRSEMARHSSASS